MTNNGTTPHPPPSARRRSLTGWGRTAPSACDVTEVRTAEDLDHRLVGRGTKQAQCRGPGAGPFLRRRRPMCRRCRDRHHRARRRARSRPRHRRGPGRGGNEPRRPHARLRPAGLVRPCDPGNSPCHRRRRHRGGHPWQESPSRRVVLLLRHASVAGHTVGARRGLPEERPRPVLGHRRWHGPDRDRGRRHGPDAACRDRHDASRHRTGPEPRRLLGAR